MNFFILIMLILCLIGLIDKILNNKLGLVAAFDKGMDSMGGIAMSMIGFYCIAITLIQNNVDVITKISADSSLDPSIVVGSILAPDMGGFSIVSGLGNSTFLIFSGVILTATLGQTISFQLPIFLASLKKEDLNPFISGLVYGILSLPIILVAVAWYLQIPNLLINLLPVIALYVSYDKTIFVLTLFGYLIRIISILLFGMVVLQLFFDTLPFTTTALISDAMVIVLRMCIVVCGSMILSDLIIKRFSRMIFMIGQKLGVNSASVMGLLLSLGTSIAMIPLFSQMDRKGKMMNAAFSVSGAYVLGGQLGFISSVVDGNGVIIYMISKIIAGLLAIVFVLIFYREEKVSVDAMEK
ncbi:MAG TPA: ethanolamine utilization protein EutH [Thomasclavelia ramosa]|nr:ethanolamine utilization protein EutH [Thomasclavelia ramosa]